MVVVNGTLLTDAVLPVNPVGLRVQLYAVAGEPLAQLTVNVPEALSANEEGPLIEQFDGATVVAVNVKLAVAAL